MPFGGLVIPKSWETKLLPIKASAVSKRTHPTNTPVLSEAGTAKQDVFVAVQGEISQFCSVEQLASWEEMQAT